MAGQPNNQDPMEALGFMGRFSASLIAPVAVYMLLWQVGVGFLQPRLSTQAMGQAVNVLSVMIPCIGVLASVVIAGRRSGPLIGGPTMMIFFLYLYVLSTVALEWLPPLLTLFGVLLAVLLAPFCPVLGRELLTRFQKR